MNRENKKQIFTGKRLLKKKYNFKQTSESESNHDSTSDIAQDLNNKNIADVLGYNNQNSLSSKDLTKVNKS
jgi:hypothetical protein